MAFKLPATGTRRDAIEMSRKFLKARTMRLENAFTAAIMTIIRVASVLLALQVPVHLVLQDFAASVVLRLLLLVVLPALYVWCACTWRRREGDDCTSAQVMLGCGRTGPAFVARMPPQSYVQIQHRTIPQGDLAQSSEYRKDAGRVRINTGAMLFGVGVCRQRALNSAHIDVNNYSTYYGTDPTGPPVASRALPGRFASCCAEWRVT